MSEKKPAEKVRRRFVEKPIPEADKNLLDAFSVLRDACEDGQKAAQAGEISSASRAAPPGTSRLDENAN